jgi:hypothetical protein
MRAVFAARSSGAILCGKAPHFVMIGIEVLGNFAFRFLAGSPAAWGVRVENVVWVVLFHADNIEQGCSTCLIGLKALTHLGLKSDD